ncbi:hypothetical protein Lalb_Chr03g0040731 [Lupinus albus]|uniref:Uncharacterized protein n=1 Tax=Lupinus albus TaxID=3870 RepID=A0A6A4QXG2_LUPAL|nr:hypothetical protein Lalb_Chr03g0040731 [Lupinus albus]
MFFGVEDVGRKLDLPVESGQELVLDCSRWIPEKELRRLSKFLGERKQCEGVSKSPYGRLPLFIRK